MTKRIQRVTLGVYFALGALKLVLLVTGYSFAWGVFDYLVIGLLIGYPIALFFLRASPFSSQVVVVILVLVVLSPIGYFIFFYFSVTGGASEESIETWSVGNYRIALTHRQDWAGPAYYRYTIKKTIMRGIFTKILAHSYKGSTLPDSCDVTFKGYYNGGKSVYTFDKCKLEVRYLNLEPNLTHVEDSLRFNSIEWKKQREFYEDVRPYMLNDLMANYLKVGMDSAAVKDLLGETWGPQGRQWWDYKLGVYREMESSYLTIDFDDNAKLRGFEVVDR